MPADEQEDAEDKPIWGQFHFFPNNGDLSEMNSRLFQQTIPYASTSFTTTIGTNMTGNSSLISATGNAVGDSIECGLGQPPIILLPSSYDLAAKAHPEDESCFNVILICGSILLVGTISATVALVFGLI